jgi:uncharacterized protein
MSNGQICYIEIPAVDAGASAKFYETVFGWNIRKRGDGQLSFDDTTGAVSGTWEVGRPPAREPSMVTYIMVDSIEATLDKVVATGGQRATPLTPTGPGGGAYATFFDPAGNQVGLYQQGSSQS